MVKYRWQGVVLLLTIITSGSLIMAQDTFSSSAAKVIQLKNQMVADIKPLVGKVDQSNGLRKFANTLKSLKKELKTFIGTDPRAHEPMQAKKALQSVSFSLSSSS